MKVIWQRKKKYNNCSCTMDGIRFDSRKECDYYGILKIEKKGNLIKDFKRQVTFQLYGHNGNEGKPILVCSHRVDFIVTKNDGTQEVREVKSYGTMTDVWKLKRKLFEANYPKIEYRVIL